MTYELYSLENYRDANTISLYDSKIVVKEYEIAASVALLKNLKNLERLSTTNVRRLHIRHLANDIHIITERYTKYLGQIIYRAADFSD